MLLRFRLEKATIAILIFLTAACLDEKPVDLGDRSYPAVDTRDATNINEQGVTLNGEILKVGGGGIRDHGFLYSEFAIETFHAVSSERISLGPKDGIGKFTAIANRNMTKDKKYLVRAYAVGKNGTPVIGQQFEFISLGNAPPVVSDIIPKEGSIGDNILIVGSGFSNVKHFNWVSIGGAQIAAAKATADSLWFKVPTEAPVGESTLSVVVGLRKVDSQKKFNLLK